MTTFEKEAKERARDYTDNKEKQVAYECGFLDGADRAKEEFKDIKALENENNQLKSRLEEIKRKVEFLQFLILNA